MKSFQICIVCNKIEFSLVVVLSDFPILTAIDDITNPLAISVFGVDIDQGNITVRCINHALLLGEFILRNSFEKLGVTVFFTYYLIELIVTDIV
jgi:hypothetical protein